MNSKIEQIKKEISDNYDALLAIRRDLHMHPELSQMEERTESVICSQLARLDIPFKKNIAGHGVIGTIYGADKTRAVAIRADIDALPLTEKTDVPFKSVNSGVMHACGHDLHTAILLGSASILKKIQSELPLSIKLLFQPSEETVGGARQMIEAGCLKEPDVSSVIGLHVETTVPSGKIQFIPGSMNAASTEFYVTVTGKSCHGAHPDKGSDPLLPACNMVSALQSIVSRRINPSDSALVTVGQFRSGSKNNIIPDETSFSGIIRALTLEMRSFVKNEVKQICENIASAYGVSCDVKFEDSYPSLENDNDMLRIIKKVSEEALGKENVLYKLQPSLGADDFSYFCHGSRGLYFNIGTQRPGDENASPIHSDLFYPDEECMKTGILIEVLGAMKIMEEEMQK